MCFGQEPTEMFTRHVVVLTSGHGVWCVNVFLGLQYRFPLFGSIGNLYGFSLHSITYFTGTLGHFIFHFEIVLMSLEFSTNVASTFTRNAVSASMLSCYCEVCEDPEGCSCISLIIRVVRGPQDVQCSISSCSRIAYFGQYRL